jgi:hypothetical protein
MSNAEVIVKVGDEGYRLSQPHECPDKVWSLITKSWNSDPAQRPSFKELVGHLSKICKATKEEEEDEDYTSSNYTGTACCLKALTMM